MLHKQAKKWDKKQTVGHLAGRLRLEGKLMGVEQFGAGQNVRLGSSSISKTTPELELW